MNDGDNGSMPWEQSSFKSKIFIKIGFEPSFWKFFENISPSTDYTEKPKWTNDNQGQKL